MARPLGMGAALTSKASCGGSRKTRGVPIGNKEPKSPVAPTMDWEVPEVVALFLKS